ncbi:MAG: TonB-dependent receptor, partial [Opitutales bacterium]|nr:TonB-dependent receptor [Opitutales bacterium]
WLRCSGGMVAALEKAWTVRCADAAGASTFLRSWLRCSGGMVAALAKAWTVGCADAAGGFTFLRSWLRCSGGMVAALAKAWTVGCADAAGASTFLRSWLRGGRRWKREPLPLLIPSLLLGCLSLAAEEVWDLGTLETIAGRPDSKPFIHAASAGGGTPSLTDALQRLPGLVAAEGFGGIDPPRLSVRGSGLQSAPMSRGLLLSVDGIPLNFADGSFHLPLIEPRLFTGVTLDARAAPLSLGGRLDWTRAPIAESGSRFTLFAGSHQTRGGLVAFSAKESTGDFGLSAGLAHIRSDGWRRLSDYERTSASASVVYDHGASRSRFHIYTSRPRLAVPVPLTEEQARLNPTSVSPAVLRDQPYRKTDYTRFAHVTVRPMGEGTVLEAKVAAAVVEDHFVQLLPNGISTNRGQEGWGALTWSRSGGITPPGETRFHLEAGVARREALRFRNEGGEAGTLIGNNRLRPLNFIGHLRQGWIFGPTLEGVLQLEGIVAERRVGERFSLSAERPSTDLNLRETHFAPRAELHWRPGRTIGVTLALSRQYEPPTFDDLLFTAGPMNARVLQSAPLRSQRADTAEFALQGEVFRTRWSLLVYESRWRGELLRLADSAGNSRGTVNAGNTQRSGAVISLERTLFENAATTIRVWGNYNWQHFRFRNDVVYEDRRLAGVAPHTFAGALEVAAFAGAYLNLGGRGTAGRTFVDHGNNRSFGGSAVSFLQAGWRGRGGIQLALRIDNLLDRPHIGSTAGLLDRVAPGSEPMIFLPGAPRRFLLDLSLSW